MARILEAKNLNVTYQNKRQSVFATVDASFELDAGDSMGIVGESGSGKSTMAMGLLRLLPERTAKVEGQAIFMGRDLFTMTKAELDAIRWKNLSVVFQKSMNSFSPVHRIGDQIEDIYRIHEPLATKEEVRARAARMLQMVNLNDRVHKLYPHEMSGGMLQRVTIAVSLLHEPDLLIMDEATTALDVVTQGQILSELKKMESELKTSRIIITHDMSVVAASCNKIIVMYAGNIVERGLVSTVMTNPSHPYTHGLLQSFPPLKGERVVLKSIPGFLPDLSIKHPGCVFASRCEHAEERCHTEKPVETDMGMDHYVACHLAKGGTAL